MNDSRSVLLGSRDVIAAVGLEKLTVASEVLVRHNFGRCAAEYTIQEVDGEELLEAKEEADCFTVLCIGSKRSFVMHLYDEMEKQVFTLQRSNNCFLDEMKVYAGNTLVCVVSQVMTWGATVLHINDEANRPVLRIKCGFGLGWSKHKLQTVDKRDIGVIGRVSCFSREFYAQFPSDLGVCYKAAVIGACILIDFMTRRNR